ncbi:MAG: tetratricopeptide repeat protein [Flavobacteriia bacterium]|nr:tetratricopeptide repeat protein [Flavobacteriia bacterium]
MEFLKKSLIAATIVFSLNTIAQDSKTQQAAYAKSYGLEAKGEYADAIRAVKEVYNESSYTVNVRLGWLYYLQQNYESSIAYYNKAIKLMPAAVEPLWGILNPLVAAEKWTEVDKTYLMILKIDPKNSTANYKLGMVYYYRKNYSAAKKYFDIALNLYPFDYNIVLMSGWNNYFLGKTAEAKTLFNKILLIDQNDASALEGLSLIK